MTEDTVATDGSLLQVKDLRVTYGSANSLALSGVELSCNAGEFVTVIGPNGAGKSTLVRAIMGLLPMNGGRIVGGRISLAGDLIGDASPETILRRGVAVVPEGRRLFGRLTIEENLRAGAVTRSDRQGIREDIDRWIGFFPALKPRMHIQARLLSGGEQQMVAVARALMSRPRLLICDELSLGLAPLVIADIYKLLFDLREQERLTIMAIEQNASSVLNRVTRSYFLEAGRSRQVSQDDDIGRLYVMGSDERRRQFAALLNDAPLDGTKGAAP